MIALFFNLSEIHTQWFHPYTIVLWHLASKLYCNQKDNTNPPWTCRKSLTDFKKPRNRHKPLTDCFTELRPCHNSLTDYLKPGTRHKVLTDFIILWTRHKSVMDCTKPRICNVNGILCITHRTWHKSLQILNQIHVNCISYIYL